MNLSSAEREAAWPALPFSDWQATAETLHMWTQIVGKIRLKLTPWINHSWHVTLYLTARGLTTSPIPHGFNTFELRFDFIDHHLRILKSDGGQRKIPLRPQSVAAFYHEVMGALAELELPVKIDRVPNEITDPIPFAARCTFSGAASTSQSRVSRGGRRRRIRAACRICRMSSRAKPTRRK